MPTSPTPASYLGAAAQHLLHMAEATEQEIETNPYWHSQIEPRPRWFAAGIENAVGGPAGELAGLLSPETARALAAWLERAADASDHHGLGEGGVVATLVHPALAVARQLLGTSAADDGDESCGRFVPDTPRAPGLCASCGDAKGWHSLLATADPAAPAAPEEPQ